MQWPPHITVATIVEKSGLFLFVEEAGEHGPVVNQPAGHLEPGETLISAARRETLEESCWEVEIRALIGIYVYHAPANDVIYHRYCFSATPLHFNDQINRDADIIDTYWLTPEQLAKHRHPVRSPLVTDCLHDYLTGKHYPLEVIQEHR